MPEEDTSAIVAFERMTVEGVSFATGCLPRDVSPGVLTLQKSQAMVDRYREILADQHRPRVVELGIAYGGSVAMLSLLTQPTKLVAIELEPGPGEALAAFIDERDLGETVRPYYGVDQSDRARVAEIVDHEFAGAPLDLVIDDAAHTYDATRSSFECLYPRLRPGGLYLIEDWAWIDKFARMATAVLDDPSSPMHQKLVDGAAAREPEQRDVPLSRFAAELVLLRASDGDVVDRVTIDGDWIVVRRGEAALDPESFRFDDVLVDYFDTLS